jgi:ribosomal protein S3AE
MAIRKKKKRFYEVEIPIIRKEILLQAYEPKQLTQKNIKYDLTRMLKGKATILNLIIKQEKEKLIAIPKEMNILPTFLRRAVRKGTSQVEDSFETECKDGRLKVKPFLVARRKISKAVRKALRETSKKEIEKILKNKKIEDIFSELMDNKIQKPLSITLKKIYPLSLCEIRNLRVLEYRETKEKPKEEKTEKETTEEKPKEEKTEKETTEEKPKNSKNKKETSTKDKKAETKKDSKK